MASKTIDQLVDLSVSGIYALLESDEVRYIGQAKDIAKRHRQHCSVAQNRGDTHKQRWISNMLANGVKPGIVILEKTSDLDSAELKWIKKYRSDNAKLVNIAEGGKNMSHCNRAKASKPWGNAWSPVQRNLITIKRSIRSMRERGGAESNEHADRLEARVVTLNETIKRVGSDVMNERLWNKYGNN